MAESLRDLVVSLSLNTDNFTRNIKSVNKQIQEAESYFKLASAGIKDFDTSAAGLSAKLEMLERKLSLQKDAVEQYKRALATASAKLQECYTRQEDYAQRLEQAKEKQETLRGKVNEATTAYENYKNTLGETDSATIAAKQNMEAAEKEYADATAEVEQLAGQNDALKRSTQNAADAVSTAQTQLNKAEAAVRETEQAIKDTTAALKTAQSAWSSAGKALTDFGEKCKSVSEKTAKLGRTLTTTVTTPIAALGTTAVKSSLEFESSFAVVKKTVNGTTEQMDNLASASKKMSTEVAASTSTINEVMATAGQLGIATDKIEEFSRVMVDIGNSSVDLSANDAATSIAKFVNIMGTGQESFSQIGSTIVDLGNNLATTEAPIMLMAQRLAAAGKQVGMTEADVLGFAAALSSVGIEAQMGGSAFSKALVKMEVAAVNGGDELKDFAKVAGVSAEEFKQMWERDASEAFMSFIVGLSKMDDEGASAIAVLNDIGITEIRLRDTLLRATNATELFQGSLDRANAAWKNNSALTKMAGIKYNTTASKLTNLKNKATLLAQTFGDDLNPTIQNIIGGVSDFIDKLMSMDSAQREQIVKFAAIAAAAGPVLLIFSKLTKGAGAVSTALGKFATSVATAGGGFSGFMKTLGSSPSVWMAVAAAVAIGVVELVKYLNSIDKTNVALKGLAETAKSWKENAANSFFTESSGLSFFNMSSSDFTREVGNAKAWRDGVIAVWSDGKKETAEIISTWVNSFKNLTASTRSELEELKATADEGGYTDVSAGLQKDIDRLNAMDSEIEKLLKRKKNKKLNEKDKIRLQELIDAREAIEVKYHLSAADTDAFETIGKKVEAEIARAQARGQEVTTDVYENALVAGAEGMAAVNKQLDAQYDKEYAVVMLIEDEEKRTKALEELNAKYRQDRLDAGREYAELIQSVVMPVWEKEGIQQTREQVDDLASALTRYSAATTEAEKADALTDINKITAGMSEKDLVEYVGLLTQIQSLLDNGMSLEEIQNMFPDIDLTQTLDQLAAIQTFLNTNAWDSNLASVKEMFGESLGEEILTITTDLDMTGAKARWEEWAADPGAITTAATIYQYEQDENAIIQAPKVTALIDKYTEVPEGATKASLKPEGICAYVSLYAEKTTGADVSGLNPTNVTALVAAYKELESGTDVSQLKPDEITAYVFKYLEGNKVDTTGLTPAAVTAFVMAYEEIQGGASTAVLTPSDIVGYVAKYCEAEGVDISALNPDQIQAIVNSFAEATGCDRSQLLQGFTAYITEYKEAEGVKRPSLSITVGLSGYDLLSYRRFLANNPVEVQGVIRLSEVYEDPSGVMNDPNVKFWKDGKEIPITAVSTDMLKPEDVCVLDSDGTMHVMIKTEVTGSEEAIGELRETYQTEDQLHLTALGKAAVASVGVYDTTLKGFIKSARERIKTAFRNSEAWYSFLFGGKDNIFKVLDQSMQNDFNPERVAELSTYVAEVVKAIMNGEEVSEEDMQNLKDILAFVKELDTAGVGGNVTAGIAEGMTEAGWDTSAETVADNLESAINQALEISSPSKRMKPAGEYAAAGIGEGATGYDFTSDGSTIATALETAISGSLSLRSVGLNAMAGLANGIRTGKLLVVSAMRTAARAAVNAAKAELKIASPSRVFRDEVGVMVMKGFDEGVLTESKKTEKSLRNAARYLTDAALEGASFSGQNRTNNYNNTNTISFDGSNFYVRDEKDIYSLAVEIASLTKRQQRGKGLRFA